MSTVFDNAISAHVTWLVRFESVMLGSSRDQFDPQQISDDTICEFALWLDANPGLFPNAERIEQVRSLHRSFHEKAATVAVLLRSQARRETIEADWKRLCDLSDQLVEAVQVELKHPQQSLYHRQG